RLPHDRVRARRSGRPGGVSPPGGARSRAPGRGRGDAGAGRVAGARLVGPLRRLPAPAGRVACGRRLARAPARPPRHHAGGAGLPALVPVPPVSQPLLATIACLGGLAVAIVDGPRSVRVAAVLAGLCLAPSAASVGGSPAAAAMVAIGIGTAIVAAA